MLIKSYYFAKIQQDLSFMPIIIVIFSKNAPENYTN